MLTRKCSICYNGRMVMKKQTHVVAARKALTQTIEQLTTAAARLDQAAGESSPAVENVLHLEVAGLLAQATGSIDQTRRHMLAIMLANGHSERGSARVLGWSTTKARSEREALEKRARRQRREIEKPLSYDPKPLPQ